MESVTLTDGLSRQERVALFAARLAAEPRDQVIPHFIFLEGLGYEERNAAYYNAIDLLRVYLEEEFSIFLATEKRVGYRLLRHGQEDRYIEQRLRDGTYRIIKANRAAKHIRLEGMENGDVVRISRLKGQVSSIDLFLKQT